MLKNTLNCLLLLCAVFFATVTYAQSQDAKDEKILKEYFAKNNIKATRTSSGLYYTINKKGIGSNAKAGEQVYVNYLGRYLDGSRFDGNMDAQYVPVKGRSALSFILGAAQVIRGWDEGVKLLNQGCRATLYIPSSLAYGKEGGPVPPNAILMFDIELLSMN